MSIRLKLIFSYTWTLFVSVVVFTIAAVLITLAMTGEVRSLRDFYTIHYSLKPLTAEEESIFLDLKYISKHDPQQLLDRTLLKDYDFKLRVVQAGLIVRKESKTVFVSPSINEQSIAAALPEYKMENYNIRDTLHIGKRFYAYAKYDYYFPDKKRGSIFVIRELSPYAEMVRKLLPIFIIILLVILILTNGVLYYYVTRSIVKPIAALKEAAIRIKDGELDFEIPTKQKDEVGQLSQAFEQMREKLKQSVERQLQYEENRKELISSISHDLKTPLTTIKGYAQGIRDGVPATQEKMDKYVNTIHMKADDMDRLIDELLLYSTLDLKRLPFTFEQVDLGRFLNDCFEDMALDFEQKHIDFRLHLPKEQPLFIMADREKLRRVIANIIDNCLKYMDKIDKRIEVTLTSDGEQATVRITDNGPGIRLDAQPHLFERFYRAEPSRNAATGGSGLGLAIAKQMIEGHGGTIWVESELGQGTSIVFTIPMMTPSGGERA